MQNNSLLYRGYFLGDRHSFSPINPNFTTNSNSSDFKSFYKHLQKLLCTRPLPACQCALLHTFYPGGTVQVCQSQGSEFSCPTTDASTNITCDNTRCPLEGPPMAPITESHSLIGM